MLSEFGVYVVGLMFRNAFGCREADLVTLVLTEENGAARSGRGKKAELTCKGWPVKVQTARHTKAVIFGATETGATVHGRQLCLAAKPGLLSWSTFCYVPAVSATMGVELVRACFISVQHLVRKTWSECIRGHFVSTGKFRAREKQMMLDDGDDVFS